MSPVRPRWLDQGGFTMIEAIVAAAIFVLVAIGAGSLYVSARRGLEHSSTESYVQRQGTFIEQRITRELKSAASAQVAPCREISPSSSPVMPANKSIVYSLYYPGRATPTEYWCIYEYQRAAYGPFPQLWRCPLAAASSDTCTGGAANAENLAPDTVRSFGGQRIEIANSAFCPSGVAPCDGSDVTPAARAFDIRFEMNVYPSNGTASLLYAARSFGFSVYYRNSD